MALSFSAVVLRLVAPSFALRVGEILISSGKPQVHMTPVSTLFCAFTSILPNYTVSVLTSKVAFFYLVKQIV